MHIRYIIRLIEDLDTRNTNFGMYLTNIKDAIFEENLNKACLIANRIIQTKNLDDKSKLQLKLQNSFILTCLGNYKEAFLISDEVIKESRRIQDGLLEVDALISKANTYFELGEPTRSLSEIDAGETILETDIFLSNTQILSRMKLIKYLKGKVYRKLGNFDEGLKNIQESLSISTEFSSDYETADILNVLGGILLSKGSNDQAKRYLKESKKIFETLKIRTPLIKILNNIGLIYRGEGKLDKAIQSYEAALKLSIALRNEKYSAILSLNIGLIYWEKGELDYALKYFKKSSDTFLELDSILEIAVCSSHIGMVYHIKGELDEALRYYEDSLVRLERLGEIYHTANCYSNIGEVHYNKGNYNEAIHFFLKSLKLLEEIGNAVLISHVLFLLIVVTVDKGLTAETKPYIDKLEEINKTEENLLISQRFRLSKAYILKESDRVINRAEAQILFKEVAEEEVIYFTSQVFAMLNLCDLLLIEFKTTGSKEVISEVKILITQLLDIARKNNSYLWLAQAYWLQSKLALIELKMDNAQSLLKQAEKIANDKGLTELANRISDEYDSLVIQLTKWQKFSQEKPIISEIIELTQIEDLVDRMITKKLYKKEEAVLDYAEKAREIAKKWEAIEKKN